MSALHHIKSYCIPAVLYGCEVWHLNDSNMQKISVAWNNCFRRIFNAVGEKALNHYKSLLTHRQYHTCYTSANYCFEKKLYCSDSVVLQSLSRRMIQDFIAVGGLYTVRQKSYTILFLQ